VGPGRVVTSRASIVPARSTSAPVRFRATSQKGGRETEKRPAFPATTILPAASREVVLQPSSTGLPSARSTPEVGRPLPGEILEQGKRFVWRDFRWFPAE